MRHAFFPQRDCPLVCEIKVNISHCWAAEKPNVICIEEWQNSVVPKNVTISNILITGFYWQEIIIVKAMIGHSRRRRYVIVWFRSSMFLKGPFCHQPVVQLGGGAAFRRWDPGKEWGLCHWGAVLEGVIGACPFLAVSLHLTTVREHLGSDTRSLQWFLLCHRSKATRPVIMDWYLRNMSQNLFSLKLY